MPFICAAGYQAAGNSNGSSGGSAISPEGWLFNICLDRQRCKIDPMNGLAQVGSAVCSRLAVNGCIAQLGQSPACLGHAIAIPVGCVYRRCFCLKRPTTLHSHVIGTVHCRAAP